MSFKKKMTFILFVVLAIVIVSAFVAQRTLLRGNSQLTQVRVTIHAASSSLAASSDTSAFATTSDQTLSSSSPTSTKKNVVSSRGDINGESTDTIAVGKAVFNVEVASTMLQKTNGLSYRTSLADDAGMLFIFGSSSVQSFWMKDMNFPLDIIWINANDDGTVNTVVGFAKDAPAPAEGTSLLSLPIYASPANTNRVLEVNAGTVDKYNIKVGDSIEIGQIQ